MNIKKLALFIVTTFLLCSCGKTSGEYNPDFLKWLSTDETSSSTPNIVPEYIVSFNTNGGSLIEPQKVKEGEKVSKPSDPTKNGYLFNYWELGGTEYSFSDYVVTEDITLNATWDLATYSITYVLNGGINDPLNPTSYTILDSFELYSPTQEGYSFDGWYCESTKIESIQTGMHGDLVLNAHWEAKSYNVNVTSEDTAKGSVTGDGAHKYGNDVTIVAVPNNGYAFEGWYQDSVKVASNAQHTFTMPAFDLTFEARFTIVTYSISYELNGGTTSSPNPTSYTVLDSFSLVDASKDHHSFLGWYSGDTKIDAIVAGMYGDLVLTARFAVETHTLTIINNYPNRGSVSGAGVYAYGDHATMIATPNTGYEFDYWQKSGSSIKVTSSPQNINIYSSDITYTVYWKMIEYPITYELDGGTNSIWNFGTYTIESDYLLQDPYKENYEFQGWYNGTEKFTGFTPGMTGAITLTASWKIANFEVKAITADESKGITSGSGTYNYGDEVTITATPNSDYIFKGWYCDEECKVFVSDSSSYSFTMPLNNVTYYADFWTQTEKDNWDVEHGVIPVLSNDGKTITYGMYPQNHVSDSELVNTLETLSNANNLGYCFYDDEYYYKLKAAPFSSEYAFDNGDAMTSGKYYWFKVEVVRWKVLTNSSGSYFVVTEQALQKHRYNEEYADYKTRTDYQGNKATVYANNYMYSEVRSWLNTDFYNQTFFLGNAYIKTTTVNNLAATTRETANNPYACVNTNDKLFLLSASELNISSYGYSSDASRIVKATEFSLASGVYAYGGEVDSATYHGVNYFTRSPEYGPTYACSVYYFGGRNRSYTVSQGNHGVVAAMRLTLDL